MTEREDVVEAVALAIKSAPTMDKAAQAAITAATPFIERALLRKILDWKPTTYGSYGWQETGLRDFARDLGYDIGDDK